VHLQGALPVKEEEGYPNAPGSFFQTGREDHTTKDPRKLPGNNPYKDPRLQPKEPLFLPRMERQTVLPLCLSNSSTNIHPTPSLNTHTLLLSLVSADVLNLT
jgi:hypothetical protein